MSIIATALTKLSGPLVDLAKEYITDKDKLVEFEYKAQELSDKSVADARAHDKASYGITFVDAIRGLVRPIITMVSFGGYVYFRLNGIELGAEDYAMLGAPMVFWFGGRRLEKGI